MFILYFQYFIRNPIKISSFDNRFFAELTIFLELLVKNWRTGEMP